MVIEVKFYLKNNNWLKDNGYSKSDEARIYKECLKDIYSNPGWYLKNLESLSEFRLGWGKEKPL